ncbi:MAG TPA: bifunctional pyr operon transcriptional regulator/uracil phosphoribosyltransferase PyrR [Microbacteriaceae bacterium]|nr:bifunctional pyr operon transcriptional regulator/uracil phosphoribosyltransferase PyrR [Microbacteriaceae bacterium]
MTERSVLSHADISRAVTRIAHEILESPRRSDRTVLLGIPTRGVTLAERISIEMERISGVRPETGALDVTMYRDDLDRRPTRTPHETVIPSSGIDGTTVILVDDVLFSGRTIRAAFDALSDIGRARNVQLAVLVDRGHREYPIRADFVGKNLPSNETERILVRLGEVDGADDVTIVEAEA